MTTEIQTLTVVLVDGKELPRCGLQRLLEEDPAVEVVATAADHADALRYLRGHKPRLLLYCLRDGAEIDEEFMGQVAEASPDTNLLVLCPEADAAAARQALRAGATGFVSETEGTEALLRAVRRAAEGEPYISSALGAAIAGLEEEEGELTAREREIVRLIALGYTNGEIANELFLSIRTVESHRAHVMSKLEASSRRELVAYAFDKGLAP